jgi:hypothetical protein
MEIIIVILLAVIALILWRIYRQKENEKETTANEKFDAELGQKQKEKFKNYPYLYGKLEGSWLEVFAQHYENGLPLLKLAFLLMLGESTKIDYSEGSMKWDSLWDASKELLEHLGKYHEGSTAEHEIAVCTYWQVAAEAVGELVKENPEIEGKKIEVEPYTNIDKIVLLFPRKNNHPAKEISFFSADGSFPRESKGSALIDEKIKALGL